MSLNDEIQPISEETANELFNAIKRANEMAIIQNEQMQILMNRVNKHCIFVAQTKSLNCVYLLFIYENKLEKATFITRWYWKKKINKTEKRLEELEEYLEELKK